MFIHCVKKDNKLIYNNMFSYIFVNLPAYTFYVDNIVDFHVKIGSKDTRYFIVDL